MSGITRAEHHRRTEIVIDGFSARLTQLGFCIDKEDRWQRYTAPESLRSVVANVKLLPVRGPGALAFFNLGDGRLPREGGDGCHIYWIQGEKRGRGYYVGRGKEQPQPLRLSTDKLFALLEKPEEFTRWYELRKAFEALTA